MMFRGQNPDPFATEAAEALRESCRRSRSRLCQMQMPAFRIYLLTILDICEIA